MSMPAFSLRSAWERGDRVSIYVERAFRSGVRLADEEIQTYCQSVARELTAWGFIETVDVIDPAWIETAYT